MKTLTLVRHAKSSWEAPGLADIDRPLNQRGRRDAPASAYRFATAFPPPDRILASPALRTRETARAFARAFDMAQSTIIEDARIHEASRVDLFSVLRELPDRVVDVMLVGHSPAIAELGHALCGTPEGKFPTCAILRMHLPVQSWSLLSEGDGDCVLFDTPRRPTLAQT